MVNMPIQKEHRKWGGKNPIGDWQPKHLVIHLIFCHLRFIAKRIEPKKKLYPMLYLSMLAFLKEKRVEFQFSDAISYPEQMVG